MGTDKFYKIVGFILIISVYAGCAPKITEEDIKRVEKLDPQFKTVLNKKQGLDSKTSSLENQIAAEKADTEVKISALRNEFQNKKKDIEVRIVEVQVQLEPEKKVIKERIEKLNAELKPLQERLTNIESMLEDTRSILAKSKDTNIALQDKAKWDTQIKTLETERGKVQKDIENLKEKIGLYDLELRIIK